MRNQHPRGNLRTSRHHQVPGILNLSEGDRMKLRVNKVVLLGSLLSGLLLSTGCAMRIGDFEIQVGDPEMLETGELRQEERTVPLEAIESAQVEVRMGAGKLEVQGGAESLMEAEFVYNIEEWQPEVSFEKVDRMGTLVVRQPFAGTIVTSEARNEWRLQFNDNIPMRILVQLGAGEGDLDLRGMDLRDVDIELGAGQVAVNLSGDWDRDFNVHLKRGVGEATLRLPSEVGVRVDVKSALGTVVGLGLTRQGESYVNDAYGESGVTIEVEVLGAIGSINLEVVE